MSISTLLLVIYSTQLWFASLIWKKVFRVLIKHYLLRKNTISETKAKLDKYEESALSIEMIYKWFIEFRYGRMNTNDAERPGRPNEVTTPEMIEKIRNIVLKDRRVIRHEIVDIMGISYEHVSNISHVNEKGIWKMDAAFI